MKPNPHATIHPMLSVCFFGMEKGVGRGQLVVAINGEQGVLRTANDEQRAANQRSSLRGEGEQDEDVDPDRSHRVPVPRGDVHNDAPSFDFETIHPGGEVGEEQRKQSAG